VLKDGTVVRVPYIQHYPPDTPALNFFLANRQRDLWRRNPVAGDLNINFSLEQLVLGSMKLREADEAKARVIEHEPTEPEKTKGVTVKKKRKAATALLMLGGCMPSAVRPRAERPGVSCRRHLSPLAAQFFHAGSDRRKIVSGAGSGHVSSVSWRRAGTTF
jgi:hypothetical protein